MLQVSGKLEMLTTPIRTSSDVRSGHLSQSADDTPDAGQARQQQQPTPTWMDAADCDGLYGGASGNGGRRAWMGLEGGELWHGCHFWHGLKGNMRAWESGGQDWGTGGRRAGAPSVCPDLVAPADGHGLTIDDFDFSIGEDGQPKPISRGAFGRVYLGRKKATGVSDGGLQKPDCT